MFTNLNPHLKVIVTGNGHWRLYYPNTVQVLVYIQGVPGGMCQTSGRCSLC